MALTTCGTTLSSYPTMPGNSGSPRWILQMRLLRSSSFTERLTSLDSEKELWRQAPRVWGNSRVALGKLPPSDRDCTRRSKRIAPIQYNDDSGDTRKSCRTRRLDALPYVDERRAARIHRGMDRDDYPAAVRHHDAGAGLCHSQCVDGELAADRRSRARG